jgi:hypothetical protein
LASLESFVSHSLHRAVRHHEFNGTFRMPQAVAQEPGSDNNLIPERDHSRRVRSPLVDNPFADLTDDVDEGVQLVQLTPERVMGQGISGGDSRPFRTVEEAVAFAMEHLSQSERDMAFIQTSEGPIQARDMERIYRTVHAAPSQDEAVGQRKNSG